jgi:uracil-DNA glycosylase
MSEKISSINHDEIVQKLSEILKPSGWHNLLKGFLVSEDFKNIIETLHTEVSEGRRFTPALRQVFRAFTECPVDKLRVIMVGQDPYPQAGVADGVAFSCGNTRKAEASLRYMLAAINKTVHDEKLDTTLMNPDLTHLANQGILMLNTALTTEINKIGKHYQIWKPFIQYLFDMLKTLDKQIIWVFMGKKTQELEALVPDNHIVMHCSHPASAAYARLNAWDCNDIFNKVNNLLIEAKTPPILWV